MIRKAKKLLELYPELLQTFGQLIPFLEPKSYLYMALLEKMEACWGFQMENIEVMTDAG